MTMNEACVFSDADMDQIKQHSNFMEPIFQSIIGYKKDLKILDVGCGNGYFSAHLKRVAKELCGIDASNYGLEQACQSGFTKTLKIDDLSVDDFPSDLQNFDLVICKDVLEHLLAPEKVIQNIHKALAKGGTLIVLVPNHFPLFYRLKFLFSHNIDTQKYFPNSKEWNFPHIRYFTDFGLRELLESNGFKVSQSFCDHFSCAPGMRRIPLLGKLFLKLLSRKDPTNFATALCYACVKVTG